MWEIPEECWDAESQICAGLGNAGGQAFDFLTGSDPTVIPLNLGFLSLFFSFWEGVWLSPTGEFVQAPG